MVGISKEEALKLCERIGLHEETALSTNPILYDLVFEEVKREVYEHTPPDSIWKVVWKEGR